MTPTRLVIVDDSSFIREAIARLLADETRIEIVGTAATGEEMLDRFEQWKPDVLTLDLDMPGMGGTATLDCLREVSSIPVIILSTHTEEAAPLAVDALSRGAVDFIDKEAYSLVDFQALRKVLVEKILSVSKNGTPNQGTDTAVDTGSPRETPEPRPDAEYELVVVGASTGGPSAVERLLTDLGSGISAPVVVAQHMPAKFTRAFAERLDWLLPIPVQEAADQEPIMGGKVYIAPGDRQLSLKAQQNALFAVVEESPVDAAYHPSVDFLFESVVQVVGHKAVAVLLTGMGDDGAQGMSRLADAGAHTIAQDESTCVVYGMPRVAVAMNAVREIQPIENIGKRLVQLFAGAET